jgi:Flp pilus assembly protein TadD
VSTISSVCRLNLSNIAVSEGASHLPPAICARMGDLASARSIWAQLVSVAPDYAPARANLALLNQTCGDACDPHKDFEPQLAAAVQARPKGED